MEEDERVLVSCQNALRWLGLSFTRIRRSSRGEFVASDSRLHLLVNLAFGGVLALAFCCINPTAFSYTADLKPPTIIYLLYTKLMILTIVMFSFCGNVHNRKFVDIINLFRRVTQELERDFGRSRGGKDAAGRRILLGSCLYMAASTAFNLWTDAHITQYYERTFRVVHYICFGYVILFTAQFAITMNYIKTKFKQVNGAFGEAAAPGPVRARRKLGAWMAAVMSLREAEGLTNEIFGKQIFLSMLLTFSRVVVNAYYLILLNLYGTSSSPLNANMWGGLFQAITVAFLSTMAAELAANEANKINEIIFHFPVHLHDWQMFKQVQYFALFSHSYRMEFKVWIFYAINYDSLLKVILTSSAITVVILQCDFLKADFQ